MRAQQLQAPDNLRLPPATAVRTESGLRYVVLKRGKGKGFAGIENPLFVKQNTGMLYGDAKKSMDAILAQLDAPEAKAS